MNKKPNYNDSKYGEEFKISKQKLVEADVDIEIIEDDKNTYIIDIGSISTDRIEEYVNSIIKKIKEGKVDENHYKIKTNIND